jgi:hypothetical protein
VVVRREAVNSSAVKSIGYDRHFQVLEVEFPDGEVYQYLDVPFSEYLMLRNADSIGTHMNTVIKPGYRFEKVS